MTDYELNTEINDLFLRLFIVLTTDDQFDKVIDMGVDKGYTEDAVMRAIADLTDKKLPTPPDNWRREMRDAHSREQVKMALDDLMPRVGTLPEGTMTKLHLKYVQSYRGYHYFRRRGQPTIRLPGIVGSAEFTEAYQQTITPFAIGKSLCGKPGPSPSS